MLHHPTCVLITRYKLTHFGLSLQFVHQWRDHFFGLETDCLCIKYLSWIAHLYCGQKGKMLLKELLKAYRPLSTIPHSEQIIFPTWQSSIKGDKFYSPCDAHYFWTWIKWKLTFETNFKEERMEVFCRCNKFSVVSVVNIPQSKCFWLKAGSSCVLPKMFDG